MKFKELTAVVLSVVMCFLCVVIAFSGENDEMTIYVSTTGNDSNNGSFDSPLATLEGAKEKAKSLQGDVTIAFRGGIYTFNNTVYFTADDKTNVTYTSYNNEKVIFTAGVAYTGFEKCTINGISALKKNVGKGTDFNTLFNGETSLPRTRFPESGYLYVKKADNSYCVNYDKLSESDRRYAGAYEAMDVDENALPAFSNPADAVVRILHFWKDEMLPVKSYDAGTGHMIFSKVTSMTVTENDRFFVENIKEALDKPGEWYLDKPEGVLYYIPKAGETAENLTLWGSDTETLVSISGTNGIHFEKIIFRGNGFHIGPERDCSQAAYDAPSCISCESAEHFTVTNCEFRDIAACGIFIGSDVQNSEVRNCIFDNIGAQAVYIRGENLEIEDERVTKNIDIVNNSISRYGRIYFNAVGILVIHANSVNVCNNEIHDGYYTAISVGWVWGYMHSITYNCKICDNLIYNIGQGWLSDMGGIYTLGNQPGTVLSGNVIHNVAADPGEGGYGGWGIYLDEGSSLMTVEKNLVFACGNDAYHLHFGSSNTIRNNIFALSGESIVRICSAPQRVTAEADTSENAVFPTATFTHNIYLTDKKVRTYSYWDDDSIKESDNIFWDITNGNDIYIGYNSDPKHATGIRTAVRKGYITNPYIIDPQFNNPAEFDFTFKDTKAVEETGFELWDFTKAGTVTGTTLGLFSEGGKTPYNTQSESVPLTNSREPFHLIMELICTLIDLFSKLFG